MQYAHLSGDGIPCRPWPPMPNATGTTSATPYFDYQGGNIIEEREGGSLPGSTLIRATSFMQRRVRIRRAHWEAIGEYVSSNGLTYDIFPNYAVGFQAIISLLQSAQYEGAGDTIDSAIATWSGATGAALTNYEATVTASVGLPGSTPLTALTPTQFQEVASGIQKQEGYIPGTDLTSTPPTEPSQNGPVFGNDNPILVYPGTTTVITSSRAFRKRKRLHR